MRTVFFARIKGSDGSFQTTVAPTPNPYNPIANPCTPARTSAGLYTQTFGQAYPVTEYKYTAGLEGAAANGNAQVSVTGAVVTVSTSIAAVATDENFWLCVEAIGDQSAS